MDISLLALLILLAASSFCLCLSLRFLGCMCSVGSGVEEARPLLTILCELLDEDDVLEDVLAPMELEEVLADVEAVATVVLLLLLLLLLVLLELLLVVLFCEFALVLNVVVDIGSLPELLLESSSLPKAIKIQNFILKI